MKTLKEINAQIVANSTKALAILDNPALSVTEKNRRVAPITTQLAALEDDKNFLQKSAGLSNMLMNAGGERDDFRTLSTKSRPNADTFIAKTSAIWGAHVLDILEKRAAAVGTKALVSGTLNVPSVLGDPALMDGRPSSILQLIPQRPKRASSSDEDTPGNTFGWLRQSARALAAGAVPDGAEKPKSGITFDDEEDHYRVYAHVTDPMPKRYLEDYRRLVEVLRTQLGEGLFEALERDVLTGTGVATATTDPVRGILATPGILTEEFDTDVLTSLSNARYTLTDTFVTPNAWVINSRDLQSLELLREDGNTGPLMFGSGRSDIEKILGDYPIVSSPLIAQGTALLGDFTHTELIIREDDHLDIDGAGALFTKNQVVFRQEGRYGFAVKKASAFVQVDLTA
jgi:HK97 family phage major capsid protein